MGLGIGCGFVIGPLYASELSPARFRGALASLFEVAIGIGILLGYGGAFACRHMENPWRYMIGIGMLPPIMIIIFLFCLPESPRYLWAAGREEEAKAVLAKVMSQAEVDSCVEDMQGSGTLVSPRSARSAANTAAQPEEPSPITQLFLKPTKVTKLLMLIGWTVSISQQLNGSEAVVYYIPTIMKSAGIEDRDTQLIYTMLIGVCRTAFIGVGCYCVDRLGRRPLLVYSTAIIAFALFLLAFGIATNAGIFVTMTALCLFMGGYAIGIGPVNMVLMSEIFPYHLRATAMSFGLFINRLASGIVASTFLSITDVLTPQGAYACFGIIATASFIFVYKMVPETQGKSLEEMDAFFQALANGDSLDQTDHVELDDFDTAQTDDEMEGLSSGHDAEDTKLTTRGPFV